MGATDEYLQFKASHKSFNADPLIKVILDDAHFAGLKTSCRRLASAGANVKVKICDLLPGTVGSLRLIQYNWL